MQWEVEAEEALKKVPVFVRKMVRRKVEDYASGKGCSTVTLQEVEEARQAYRDGGSAESTSEGVVPVDPTSLVAGEISPEFIQKLESLTEERGVIKTPFSILRACSAPFGCPRQVMNPGRLMVRLALSIEKSGYREFLKERVQGPVLTHHKFRVALAGCPNACSQPQIVDFGVIGRAIPKRTLKNCVQCMECQAACQENAIKVLEAEPILDYAECVGCGDCAGVCPTGTVVIDQQGYTIVAGGRLGRHPQFAQEIVRLADEDQVEAALRACLDLYMKNAQGAERFTSVFNRLGVDMFKSALE